MDPFFVILGVVGWTLALLFVLILVRMAGDQDRAARHEQKRIDPSSDVTITKIGEPPETGGRRLQAGKTQSSQDEVKSS
jgi:hypothetical protein